jgi:hypothetical protein
MDRKSIIALILSGLITVPVAAQAPAPGAVPAPANPNVQTAPGMANLILVSIEDFEEAEDWNAHGTSPLGETKAMKMVQRGDIRAADDENTRPPDAEAYSVISNPENPNHVLGIKTWFEQRGFDRVEVKPPHEYVIKGKARQFSIWVLGRKFRHRLSLKVRDYRGKIHTLDMGRLDFFGWKKLTVTIPGWLPQSTRYSLLDKNLHFISLFVTSDVHEVPGTFYFYLD